MASQSELAHLNLLSYRTLQDLCRSLKLDIKLNSKKTDLIAAIKKSAAVPSPELLSPSVLGDDIPDSVSLRQTESVWGRVAPAPSTPEPRMHRTSVDSAVPPPECARDPEAGRDENQYDDDDQECDDGRENIYSPRGLSVTRRGTINWDRMLQSTRIERENDAPLCSSPSKKPRVAPTITPQYARPNASSLARWEANRIK
jgi:hypothetical protein